MIGFHEWLSQKQESGERVPLISWGPSHEKVAKMYAEACVAQATEELELQISDLEADRDEWRAEAEQYARLEDRRGD